MNLQPIERKNTFANKNSAIIQQDVGICNLLFGTMKGQKTTTAILICKNYARKHQKVLILKSSKSERENERLLRESSSINSKDGKMHDCIITHDGLTIQDGEDEYITIKSYDSKIALVDAGLFIQPPSPKTVNGTPFNNHMRNPLEEYDVLWIDELHFYDYETAKQLLDLALNQYGLIVYITMIDSYVNGGHVRHLDFLLPSENVTRFSAICDIIGCNNHGLHHAYTMEVEQWIEFNEHSTAYGSEPVKYKLKPYLVNGDNNTLVAVSSSSSSSSSSSLKLNANNIYLKVGFNEYQVLCRGCNNAFQKHRSKYLQ